MNFKIYLNKLKIIYSKKYIKKYKNHKIPCLYLIHNPIKKHNIYLLIYKIFLPLNKI